MIGDGALCRPHGPTRPMNNAGAMNSRLIVVSTTNDMSIAPPVGAMRATSRACFSAPHLSFAPRDRQATLAEKLPKALEIGALRAEEFAAAW